MAAPYMFQGRAFKNSMPLIPHMITLTMRTDLGNTSLAVPPTHFHWQHVCPKAEPEQLAQAGPAERQLKLWLRDMSNPGKPAVAPAAFSPLTGARPGRDVCARPKLM